MTLIEFLSKNLDLIWTICAGVVVGLYTLISRYKKAERDVINAKLDTLDTELSELRKLLYDTRETFVTVSDLDNAVRLIINSNEKTEKKFEALIGEIQETKADKENCKLLHELSAVKRGRRSQDKPV